MDGTDTFPCDSQILRMEAEHIGGPYQLIQQVRNRSHFSPKLMRNPDDGKWMMFMTGVTARE